MAITRQKKEEIVGSLTEMVGSAGSVVFVHFNGLSVADANEMRQELRNEGVSFSVVKKTLLKRVLGSSGVAGDEPALDGEIAVAWSDDAIAAAKGIRMFQKKLSDAVVLVGGIFEARYLNKSEVEALAAIPGRQELYGQLVGLMNAPIRQTVVVLNEVTRSFVSVIDQIAQARS